jgi:tagatose 6-phosphate kinase
VILCVCLNPAVDVTYRVPRLVPGATHRVREVTERAGGKGVNVARVAASLGGVATVLAPVGGATGEAIAAGLPGAVLVPVAGASRRTVAVVDGAGATLLNEPGPRLSAAEWDAVAAAFAGALRDAEVVVLSGSTPPGAPPDAYRRLTALAGGVPVVVDADGTRLELALEARPWLVKPNLAELATVVPGPLASPADVAGAARELVARGARNVVVSCGPDGVVAVTADGAWTARPPHDVAGNPTGAGDALVAALALGAVRGAPWPAMLADGVAASAAAVAAPVAGEVDPAAARGLRPGVVVEELEDPVVLEELEELP